jgi:hypothetical protein
VLFARARQSQQGDAAGRYGFIVLAPGKFDSPRASCLAAIELLVERFVRPLA